MLDDNQTGLLQMMLEVGALKFGDFTLKSGRKSPYFINTGSFDSGRTIAQLAAHYVRALETADFGPFDLLYGPAYKGIPLAVAIATAWAEATGEDVGWAFDRKEAKDHGEGGLFVGAPLAGRRIVVVDDLMTAGTSVRVSLEKLSHVPDAKVVGILLAFDREERGKRGGDRATVEIADEFGIPVRSIVGIGAAVDWLHGRAIDGVVHVDDETRRRMEAYGTGQLD